MYTNVCIVKCKHQKRALSQESKVNCMHRVSLFDTWNALLPAHSRFTIVSVAPCWKVACMLEKCGGGVNAAQFSACSCGVVHKICIKMLLLQWDFPISPSCFMTLFPHFPASSLHTLDTSSVKTNWIEIQTPCHKRRRWCKLKESSLGGLPWAADYEEPLFSKRTTTAAPDVRQKTTSVVWLHVSLTNERHFWLARFKYCRPGMKNASFPGRHNFGVAG